MPLNSNLNSSPSTLAIALLSYNSLKLVKDFLPLILQYKPQRDDIVVWLIDNASSDGTYDYVQRHFPEVKLLRHEVNMGFTNGYVAALHQIPAKYYVLISSDIEVSPGFCDAPLALLESDEKIAAVQPKIKSWHENHKFEYAGAAGGYIDFLGYPFCRGRLINIVEEDTGQYQNVVQTFWASGACLFIRADAYHLSGGLDNDFYAHMEEIDLCWRLQHMGYKIMYHPNSTVYHMGGYIITYGSMQKVYRNHRNNLIMLLKNESAFKLLWLIPLRFGLDALAFWKMVIDGEYKVAKGIIKAHWEFLRYFGKWYQKRIQVNRLIKNRNAHGIWPHSIIWQVFINKKSHFTQLPGSNSLTRL
jgi:GT2 family glycosyltransferase